MKNKKMFKIVSLITLALSACLSGCGKQDVAPVMAATVEQQTLTYEVTTEEESVIATEEETESIQESETDETETESVTVQDFTITEMNVEMQATQNAVTFETPSADTAVGGVKQDEIVKVTGIVDGTDWYRIEQTDNTTSFIESIYLKDIETPAQQQDKNNTNNNEDQKKDENKQQPKAETPSKTDPQPQVDPPVIDPAPQPDQPSDGVTILPDGSVMTSDGTIVKPGDDLGGAIAGGTSAAWGMSDYY